MKAYFDFKEVFRWAIDLFETLLPSVRYGLHLSYKDVAWGVCAVECLCLN